MSNETESADGIDQFWDVRAKKAEAERDAALSRVAEVERERDGWMSDIAEHRDANEDLEADNAALREVVEAARHYKRVHGLECDLVPPCADCRAEPCETCNLRAALARLDARDATAQDETPGGADGTDPGSAHDQATATPTPTGGLSPEQRAEVVLPPCQRDGSGSDWWRARHVSCTGSHHLDSAHEVMCACPCHRVAVPLVGESVSRQPLNPTPPPESAPPADEPATHDHELRALATGKGAG